MALELYRHEQANVSLVILDLVMPEMGGRECLDEILKINSQAKVIISGPGYPGETSHEDKPQTAAKALINKPYQMRQLLKIVRDVLDQ